jgi:hypothetical protein
VGGRGHRRDRETGDLRPLVRMAPLERLEVVELLALKRELVVAHATVLRELLDRGLDAEGRVRARG